MNDIPTETKIMWPRECPLHDDHHEDIRELKIEIKDKATVQALKEACNKIRDVEHTKLSKWVFILFVTSMAVFISIASTAVAFMATTYLKSSERMVTLEANQRVIMEYYGLRPVVEPKEAKEIINNGTNSE